MKTSTIDNRRHIVVAFVLAFVLHGAMALAQQGDATTLTLPTADKRTYVVLAAAEAKTASDLPLVVFLHPCTDPNDTTKDFWRRPLEQFQQEYWPMLKDRHCVVAVPTGKSGRMWLAGEEQYVQDVIDDVQKQYKIDPGKIILLGISGGGQLALFLADNAPKEFRALIVVSTNPVVIRRHKDEWFYPNREVLKTCPYFVVNPLTAGSALVYWRQVRERLSGDGASISIVPVLGKGEHPGPPKELAGWLDEVLAGKQPQPLADAQGVGVAAMFHKVVEALPAAIEKAAPAATTQTADRKYKTLKLSAAVPPEFEPFPRVDAVDSNGRPIAEVRMEHVKDAVYVRCDARRAESPMADVMAAEENDTRLRGMLYQVYHTGKVTAASGAWDYRIGSITFPDRSLSVTDHRVRGWVSQLFIQAWQASPDDPKRWTEVMVWDETQEPVVEQMAVVLKTLLGSIRTGE